MTQVVLKEDLDAVIVGVATATSIIRLMGGEAQADILEPVIKSLNRLQSFETDGALKPL